jgi:DNA gyrase subunit A
MVQRTSVRGINRYGRTSQGVKVMNLREGDVVSAVALIMESEATTAAPAATLEGLEDGMDDAPLGAEDEFETAPEDEPVDVVEDILDDAPEDEDET